MRVHDSWNEICWGWTFSITKFNVKHSCWWQEKNNKVTLLLLADIYLEDYRLDSTWKLKAFTEKVRAERGFTISTFQAWMTRMRAMLKLQSNFEEEYEYANAIIWNKSWQFGNCEAWFDKPRETTISEIIHLSTRKNGFLRGCSSVIGVEGSHLRGAFTGQVLVVVRRDINNHTQ